MFIPFENFVNIINKLNVFSKSLHLCKKKLAKKTENDYKITVLIKIRWFIFFNLETTK